MEIMIDLETMGLGPTPAIVQIGAVLFEPFGIEIDRTFKCNINLQSSLMAGLRLDESTVEWWRSQSAEARSSICGVPSYPLEEAIRMFDSFWETHKPTHIWSHGAASDVPWLEAAYHACDRKVPWRHTAVQDTRTLFRMAGVRGWERSSFSGVEHDALYDAREQARAVQSAISSLNLVIDPPEN